MPRLHLTVISCLAIASLAMLAVACGDDDNDNTSATDTPAVTSASTSTSNTPAATTGSGTPETPSATDEQFTGARNPVEGQAVGTGAPILTDVRTGAHADYDRITFEFEDATRPHYLVQYITPPATGCGSGEPATIAGNAVLEVKFMPANAHDDQGGATLDATELTPNMTTLLEAEQTCDFEADVVWDLGLAQESDFRVVELDNPPRIAVDVGHP